MAIQLRPEERDLQVIVNAIIQLVQGRMNSVGEVTFRPNQTTTFVDWPNASKDSRAFLTPRTSSAMAAMGQWLIADADYVQGGFTITHNSSPAVDRNFHFVCIGG